MAATDFSVVGGEGCFVGLASHKYKKKKCYRNVNKQESRNSSLGRASGDGGRSAVYDERG